MIWLFWIRIRTGNADPNPGQWKFTKINQLTWLAAFQKGTFVNLVFLTKYLPYFNVKFQLVVRVKVCKDPDLDLTGSHWFGSLGPDLDPQ
jgi:hypothetical protein